MRGKKELKKKLKGAERNAKKVKKLRDEYRREVLALSGIDADKVEKLQKKYDKLMAAPLESISKELGKGAEEIKARHRKTLRTIQQMPKRSLAMADPGRMGRRVFFAAPQPSEGRHFVILDPETFYGTVSISDLADWTYSKSDTTTLNDNKASAEPKSESNECNPYLELHGPGDGVSAWLEVWAWCTFFIEPEKAGYYRIDPYVLLNGYYLFQTLGCDCSGKSTSSGDLKLFLTMTVEYKGRPIHESKNEIYSHAPLAGDLTDFEPIDIDSYFSAFDPNLSRTVHLDKPEREATIEVGLVVRADISGCGQIKCDFEKNPNFYFQVPHIDVWKVNLEPFFHDWQRELFLG